MAGPGDPKPVRCAMDGSIHRQNPLLAALPHGLPNARPWMAGQGYP
jgi:hypothetical protein